MLTRTRHDHRNGRMPRRSAPIQPYAHIPTQGDLQAIPCLIPDVLILYNALTDREDDLPMIADDTPIVSNKTNGEQRKGD